MSNVVVGCTLVMAISLFLVLRNLKSYLRHKRKAARVRHDSASSFASLRPVKVGGLPPLRDVIAISVVRNEMLRMPDFLRHYRKLGVRRFVIVDNGSTDTTGEFLADQPDVDLWHTLEPYSSRSRILWINALARRMGVGRWCLIVDADEQLVYDGFESRDLNELTALLERRNLESFPCLMLDMYSDLPIKQTVVGASERLVDVCPYFDRYGYRFTAPHPYVASDIRRIEDCGGPRHRLLSTPTDPFSHTLAKVPLAKWHKDTTLVTSHRMHPFEYNVVRINGCLLHFKFLADFHSRVVEAVQKEQYAQQSREYKRYYKLLGQDPDKTLIYGGSERYLGPESLINADLMTRLWKFRNAPDERN